MQLVHVLSDVAPVVELAFPASHAKQAVADGVANTSKELAPRTMASSKRVGKVVSSTASTSAKTPSTNSETAEADAPRKTKAKGKQSKATPQSEEDASVSVKPKAKIKKSKTTKGHASTVTRP